MIKLGELVMILDLHRQGLTVSAIARQLGIDRKTVRSYIANAPDFLELLGHFLLGLADFFALLAERLKEFGKQLLEQISAIPENKGNAS